MFRDLRRKKQLLSREETTAVLNRGTSGVLALSGDDGYPYAVPISYVYDQEQETIYFHCAKSGHKLDAIQHRLWTDSRPGGDGGEVGGGGKACGQVRPRQHGGRPGAGHPPGMGASVCAGDGH